MIRSAEGPAMMQCDAPALPCAGPERPLPCAGPRESPCLLQELSPELCLLPPQESSQAGCPRHMCLWAVRRDRKNGLSLGRLQWLPTLAAGRFPGGGCTPRSSICPVHMFSNLPPHEELCLHPRRMTVYCWEKAVGSVVRLKVMLPSLQVGVPRQSAAPA